MKPLISIIIPAYNRSLLIGETLDSIIAQTYCNWECILVDDGSTDNTEAIVRQYIAKDKRIQFYHRPKNRQKGANACRNYGFEMSKGIYIQWFDSDDLMHPSKLEIKRNEIENTLYDFVVSEGIEYVNNINNIKEKWNKIYSNNVLKDHITGSVNFHTNGPMFKRSFLDSKNLFNESLMRKQEWEFYSRLLTFSTNYKAIHQSLYYFRSHSDSMNGRNHISTLYSRIKANQQVYLLVQQNFKLEELEKLRKHFFNKYVLYLKLAVQSKKSNLIYTALKAIYVHLPLQLIIKGGIKTIHKPSIVINLFK